MEATHNYCEHNIHFSLRQTTNYGGYVGAGPGSRLLNPARILHGNIWLKVTAVHRATPSLPQSTKTGRAIMKENFRSYTSKTLFIDWIRLDRRPKFINIKTTSFSDREKVIGINMVSVHKLNPYLDKL